jgi:hypothetical protein
MTKTISITPQVVLALLGGARLRDPLVPVSADAKVVKFGCNNQTQEFWVTVNADSFDDRYMTPRQPQEFRLEIQK